MSSKWQQKIRHPSYKWYRMLRPFVFARDNYKCRLLIPDVCTYKATEVHHVKGVDPNEWENPDDLLSACSACNKRVGDPTKNQGRAEPSRRINWGI
jgi:5-methylcytosine-specific restriction endonuclease McrA